MPDAPLRVCSGRPTCRNRIRGRGLCPECASARERTRKRDETWRHARGARGGVIDVYQTREWKAARLEFLRTRPLCVDCLADGVTTAATVVDHEIPHRGDQRLMWDRANWRSRCKPHHDSKTAREVHARRSG